MQTRNSNTYLLTQYHMLSQDKQQRFKILFESQANRLRHFFRKKVANAHDVEDLVQNTFLKAIEKYSTFKGSSQLETWLYGIAKNLLFEYYRGKTWVFFDDDVTFLIEREEEPSMAIRKATDPSELMQLSEALEQVTECHVALPSDVRNIIELVVHNEMSYEEASNILNIPIGTLRSRLFRAREKIKYMFSKYA